MTIGDIEVEFRDVEGAFNAVNVTSWRSTAGGGISTGFGGIRHGRLGLPVALRADGWDRFLKLRFINELPVVLICGNEGRPIETAVISLGLVGLRAPCASLCFVEIPLPEGILVGASPVIVLRRFVLRGILGRPDTETLGAGLSGTERGAGCAPRDLSGEKGSGKREVGEVE